MSYIAQLNKATAIDNTGFTSPIISITTNLLKALELLFSVSPSSKCYASIKAIETTQEKIKIVIKIAVMFIY